VIRNHDELECLAHGTVWTPARPSDAAGPAPADVSLAPLTQRGTARLRVRPPAQNYRLSDRDRRILAGDESAYEPETPGQEEEPAMTNDEEPRPRPVVAVMTARQLGEQALASGGEAAG
jgi:hypothetical protein